MGTLGVVLRAKRQGIIADAAPLVRAMIDAGWFLSDALARTTLAAVGEQWP